MLHIKDICPDIITRSNHMKISKTVLNEINNLISDNPPETGGILGSKDNNIITDVIMDKIKNSSDKICCYEPNVDYFNQHIDKWVKKGIAFKGIFHTHFVGVKTLSCADKKYISAIMENMPEEITYLYFPVFVLPNRELVCYRAEKTNKEIKIYYENVIVV